VIRRLLKISPVKLVCEVGPEGISQLNDGTKVDDYMYITYMSTDPYSL